MTNASSTPTAAAIEGADEDAMAVQRLRPLADVEVQVMEVASKVETDEAKAAAVAKAEGAAAPLPMRHLDSQNGGAALGRGRGSPASEPKVVKADFAPLGVLWCGEKYNGTQADETPPIITRGRCPSHARLRVPRTLQPSPRQRSGATAMAAHCARSHCHRNRPLGVPAKAGELDSAASDD